MQEYIAPIIMIICFSSMGMVLKSIRQKGASTQAVFAISGLAAPAWFLLFVVLLFHTSILWTWTYIVVVFSWVILVILRHSITLKLMKYKALSEMAIYGFGFSLLVSIIIDVFFFKEQFSSATLFAFAFFFIAGILVSTSRLSIDTGKFSILKTIVLLGFASMLTSIFFSIYKVGLHMQSLLVHVALCQCLLQMTTLSIGYSKLKECVKKGIVKRKHMFGSCLVMVIGVFAEAYALVELPITVVALSLMIPLIMYSVFDLKRKDLHFSKRTVFAAGLIGLAIWLLTV